MAGRVVNYQKVALPAGLYLVATPIGSARDITLRALDVLASASAIAAEDTRSTRKLMDIHGVPLGGRQLVAYHEHSAAETRARLIARIAAGESVAYVSEAGTPLVSDPGFGLVRDAASAGLPVTAVPGPSAVLAALSVSGLGTDRFLFAGFLPPAAAARRRALADLAPVPATLVLFETARRVGETFTDLCEVLGPTRQAALCRELTKRFEEVRRGTLRDLADGLADAPPQGEIVLVIDRAGAADRAAEEDVEAALRDAMATMRVKDAANAVAGAYGLPRREVYQLALKLAGRE